MCFLEHCAFTRCKMSEQKLCVLLILILRTFIPFRMEDLSGPSQLLKALPFSVFHWRVSFNLNFGGNTNIQAVVLDEDKYKFRTLREKSPRF